jgi:hypothetical protein
MEAMGGSQSLPIEFSRRRTTMPNSEWKQPIDWQNLAL